MIKTILSLTFFILPLATQALVSPQEASRLGKDLTPVGAEKQGNGSDIPAWNGGLTINKELKAGSFHANPFADDNSLLRISSVNMEKYAARLSPGQKALLTQFPDYYLEVYPSRRSASYPQYVYDAIKANATHAKLLKYGSGVSGTTMSSPFPIPSSGVEALWNHTLRFRGHSWAYSAVATSVLPNGQRMDVLREYQYYVAYSKLGAKAEDLDNKVFFLKRKNLAPAKMAGGMTLVHETLDQIEAPRASWVYVQGQRRLRRTPDLAYDTADINTDSIRTIDQVDIFNGAPDYYEWTLVGKQELLIPYNAYRVHQDNLKLNDILLNNHLNPKYLRYEPHRVWVVEANLRVGFSHRYAKRRYYLDEDSWSIVLAEEYDSSGKLLQVTEAHTINYYDIGLVYPTVEVTYDLTNKRYYAEGLDNERPSTINFQLDFDPQDFSPNALRRDAVR
ncbi:MAG: hypothetical protein RL217_374 [Pseudomonadota bacterium]|jgi:hypothetical protein